MALRNVEFTLINAGIKSLDLIELPSTLFYLSLHGNQIKQIENLSHLKFLKQLDLSSNNITKISSLEQCSSLKILNLSCNSITKVEGIEALRNLLHIDLSYNKVSEISGFKSFTEGTHVLHRVDLFGNNLSSLKHVISALCFCKSLSVLNLQWNHDTNPVCSAPGYRSNIILQMPWINYLDGFDKLGKQIKEDDNNVPGLDEYLELLETSSGSVLQSNDLLKNGGLLTEERINTPKIDSALSKYKQRNKNVSTDVKGNIKISHSDADSKVTARLDSLEDKLQTLVDLCVKKESLKEEQNVCPVHEFDSVFEETGTGHSIYEIDSVVEGTGTEGTGTEDNSYKLTSVMEQQSCPKKLKQKQSKLSVKFPQKNLTKQKLHRNLCKKDNKNIKTEQFSVVGLKASKGSPNKRNIANKEINSEVQKYVRSPEDDETCLALMQEVNIERERRWKAELASNKLMENMKKYQERLIEDKKFQEGAVAVTEKLKQVYDKEKKLRLEVESLLKINQEEKICLKDQVNTLQKNDSEQKKIIVTLQETVTKLERDKTEEQIHYKNLYQEIQLDMGGAKRELELLRHSAEKRKEEIRQLQDLLISREYEHKKLLENMIPEKEVQELVEKAVLKEQQREDDAINQYKLRLEERNREYNALEDEFRMALQLEANRYNKLHEAYEQNKKELHELSLSFESLKTKEIDGRTLVAELTSMVREQKTKISELIQSKQEIIIHYKDRVKTLETEAIELRQLASKVESLQQDKDRMASHILSQESVIQGLRSERKCWSEELAQQSSSLALDRNRLDALVDAQKNEISLLNKKLADCEDSLKIKTKMIIDQTDTIKDMKMDLSKVKNDLKIAAEDFNKERACIEEELEQEKLTNKSLQEKVDALIERKEALKENLLSSENELAQCKNEARELREKWKERSSIIDQLETKVIKMKNSFEEKEKLLREENKLLKMSFKELEEKHSSAQTEHLKEVNALKHDFELKTRKIIAEKDDELVIAKQQVCCVEEEMRALLEESEKKKKFRTQD